MKKNSAIALLSPAVFVIGVFMVLPLCIAVVYSFMTADYTYGGVKPPFTFDAYVQFLFRRDFDGNLHFSPTYLITIGRSLYLAVLTTIACLLLGLPVAWYIVCQKPQHRRLLLFFVTLPFWINTLIRTYCWVLILQDQGLANGLLENIHIISSPLHLLYNDGAILLGLIYTFLPFMILPIYSTLERIDPRLIEAGYDLYANRTAVFRRIIWPLAKPGALVGASLVFAPALGSFLAPDLLGGGKNSFVGSLIQTQFLKSRNWPFGSVFSIIVTLAVLLVFVYRSRKVPVGGENR